MPEGTPIRVGVIGAGSMGSKHANVAAALDGCAFVGVYDVDQARAKALAARYHARVFSSLHDLISETDAVVIATPHTTHAELGSACLEAGRHVLIEKPIAASIEEGEELVETAALTKRVLMIAHIERFNPATATALSLVDTEQLFALEFHRLSQTPGRDKEADVIFDLMIHDLDLVLAFAQNTVVDLDAMGHCVGGGLIDHANALLRFENGVTAALTASVVSQERSRTARIFTRDAVVDVDFGAKTVTLHRQGRSASQSGRGATFPAAFVEQVVVPEGDALVNEHEHFYAAIRTGESPVTDGKAGLAALELAYSIQECISEQMNGRG